MAKRVKKRTDSKLYNDFMRERRRIQRQFKSLLSRGYTTLPDIPLVTNPVPDKITRQMINTLKMLTSIKITYRSTKGNLTGLKARTEERKVASKKANETKKAKHVSRETLFNNLPSETEKTEIPKEPTNKPWVNKVDLTPPPPNKNRKYPTTDQVVMTNYYNLVSQSTPEVQDFMEIFLERIKSEHPQDYYKIIAELIDKDMIPSWENYDSWSSIMQDLSKLVHFTPEEKNELSDILEEMEYNKGYS